MPDGETVKNWGGLLRRLATQRAIDALRRRKTDRLGRALSGTETTSPRAEACNVVLNGELGEQLRRALAALPGSQAEVFCLRHLCEMSYEEISREVDMSTDAVGVTLHRAKARLRQMMEEYAEEAAGHYRRTGEVVDAG